MANFLLEDRTLWLVGGRGWDKVGRGQDMPSRLVAGSQERAVAARKTKANERSDGQFTVVCERQGCKAVGPVLRVLSACISWECAQRAAGGA